MSISDVAVKAVPEPAVPAQQLPVEVPIYRPLLAPEVPVEKLDGPLAQLLADKTTAPSEELELTIRCETAFVNETKQVIRELQGQVVDSVRWGKRGQILHAYLSFGKVRALATYQGISKIGLLQYFNVNR